MERVIESRARTNKLYCSKCFKDIKRGEMVIFELVDDRMENAFCSECGEKELLTELIDDSVHPFDLG